MNVSNSLKSTNTSCSEATKATKPVTAEVIIDLTLIAQLKKDIAKIGTQPSEGITKRQAVILLVNEITDARARKVSFKAIEEALKARGIFISAATIGTYWRQAMADIEAAKPKPIKPVPEVIAAIPEPALDIVTLEETLDDVETRKSPIEFRDITDDDELEDDEITLRRIRGETANTELGDRG